MSTPAAQSGSSATGALIGRQRERRQALTDLLATLTRAMDRRDDLSLMRGTFEETLRRVLPVRMVQLKDPNSRWSRRQEGAAGAESIALEVPGCEGAGSGVLEATFEPGAPLGEWDFQMLGVAAHIAALILEIERARMQLARAGLLTMGRARRENGVLLIGSTPQMQALRDTIARVAATDFTVLLEGESGVGKELVARQIHDCSRRRSGPFVAINCAALVETLLEAELFGIEDRIATGVKGRRGKFESADGGTLFLDEVSDLSASAQAKLLRAIQDLAVERVGGNNTHRLDIRIVAATNRRLGDLVGQGLFRADLFYRLSGVDVQVPSLRDRRPDVLELAYHFLAKHVATRHLRFSPEAIDAMLAYDWPGNVRELERLIERSVALCASSVIQLEDLPAPVGATHARVLAPSLRCNDTLRAWAARYVHLTVGRCGGNKRAASRALGISYHTLQAYLRAAERDDPLRFAAVGAAAESAT